MIELARHARMYMFVYACQLVGHRQMHNYIYIYGAHTVGKMLMIACMQ